MVWQSIHKHIGAKCAGVCVKTGSLHIPLKLEVSLVMAIATLYHTIGINQEEIEVTVWHQLVHVLQLFT